MTVKVARLPARAMRYRETGSGTAVVLLHAFPLSADQWLPQLSRIPPGVRVLAPDLRGFGSPGSSSGDDPGSPTMDEYARDVLELLTHLDIARAVVCGLSMGGYVAFGILRQAARRVAALVLADTRAAADTQEGRAARDQMMKLLEQEGPAGVAESMAPKLVGRTTAAEQPDLVEAVKRLIQSNGAGAIAAAIRALKDRPDSTRLLGSISCPTTIVCGAEDTLTPPSDSEAMHRAIAHSRLVILPRAGHLSNLEDPFGFSEALFSRVNSPNNQ